MANKKRIRVDVNPEQMTMAQAAYYLQVKKQSIYLALRNKRLQADKLGKRCIFKKTYLDEYKKGLHVRNYHFKENEIPSRNPGQRNSYRRIRPCV